MLNNNFANVTSAIAKNVFQPTQTVNRPNIANALTQSLKDYYDYSQKQEEKDKANTKLKNLQDAYASGDENAINQARLDYDAESFLKSQDAYNLANRQNENAIGLEKLRQQYNLDTLNKQHENAIGLAKLKAELEPNKETGTSAMQNYDFLKGLGYDENQAIAMSFGNGTEAIGGALVNGGLGAKVQDAYDKKIGENLADEQIAENQLKTLTPRVQQALDRAIISLDNGTGLGQIGGWGWTTGQGGINRANISNAQAQINTIMRGLLKNMGVGATELNSAAEAEAYRYLLKHDMPIEQQRQVIKNFVDDYLSGKLEKDLRSVYGSKSSKDGVVDWSTL